jgi:vacuolar-type H+-ATPase subunit E/Vma4
VDAEELLASLRKEAGEKIKAIWRETEAEAARFEAEQAAALEAFRCSSEDLSTDETGRRQADLLLRARREAARRRHAAEQDLAERFFVLAEASLPELGADGRGLLARLAGELPLAPWERVVVNGQDAAAARTLFPGAVVATDNGIPGGMEVASAGNAIRIVNTLDRRLRNLWDDIVPELIGQCNEAIQGG